MPLAYRYYIVARTGTLESYEHSNNYINLYLYANSITYVINISYGSPIIARFKVGFFKEES